MAPERQATFLTATYAPDFERFSLLRESIERCEIDIPHVAVVQDEDMARFAGIPFRNKLKLLSTRDVFPREIERRRRLWGVRRRNPRRWFGGKPIHGWVTQQLVKLSGPQVADTDAIVCVDSDLFFVRNVQAAEFYDPDGRVHLYETTDDLDAEMAEWLGRNMRFVGVSPTNKPLSRFTHWPVPLRRDVVLDLQRLIEQRHGRDWYNAILDFDMLAEYTMYGAYAKYVDQMRRVASVRPPLTAYFWWREQVEALEDTFREKVIADPGVKVVGIQANVGRKPAEYRALAESAWAQGAAV